MTKLKKMKFEDVIASICRLKEKIKKRLTCKTFDEETPERQQKLFDYFGGKNKKELLEKFDEWRPKKIGG